MPDEERVEFTQDQVGCARCHGEGHKDLVYKPFTHTTTIHIPVESKMRPFLMTHWATCPTTGEPIFFGRSLT
jgi:hypothetical protein